MSEHYQGSCHCGAIKFSYDGDKIEKALRCNCSLCSRKGAIMTPQTIPIETLTIEAESGVMSLYQFGAETAKHFFCKNCGIYTFHETARFPGQYRVNIGCLHDFDSTDLAIDIFDGKNLL